MTHLKTMIFVSLLSILSFTSTYADTNTTDNKDAMNKIDSIEDDILSSLEADAKGEGNTSKKKDKGK